MKLSTFFSLVCLAVSFALAADIVDNAAVIKMTKGHVPEPIILKMIATQQTQFEFSAEKMIELTQAGVSENVISAMVSHGGEAQPQAAAAPTLQATSPSSSGRTGFGGVELRLKVTHEISSKDAREGDPVEFVLIEETKVGNLVLPAGSKASGHVRRAIRKGAAGAPGRLMVAADSIKAPDGTSIHLMGFLNGDSGPVVSGKDTAVRVFDPLARGKDATIKEETEFTVRTLNSRE